MRISELIIRFIDWFYRKPVAAILPRQTFRYIVCGGANVVFSWVCYFLVYNFVLDKEQLDLGFVVVSAYVDDAADLSLYVLHRVLAEPLCDIPPLAAADRDAVVPLPAVDRRLGDRELCRVEIFRGVLRIVGHAVADAGDFRHDDLQLSGRQILYLPSCGGLTVSCRVESPTARSLRKSRRGIFAGKVFVNRRFENGDFTAFRAVLFCGSSRFRSLP